MTARNAPGLREKTLVLLALAGGKSRHAAAAKAGVTYRTFCHWQSDDPEFAAAVEVASGTGREMLEAMILEAGKKDWRATFALYESIHLPGRQRKGMADGERPYLPGDDQQEPIETVEARVRTVLALLRQAGVTEFEPVEQALKEAGMKPEHPTGIVQ